MTLDAAAAGKMTLDAAAAAAAKQAEPGQWL